MNITTEPRPSVYWQSVYQNQVDRYISDQQGITVEANTADYKPTSATELAQLKNRLGIEWYRALCVMSGITPQTATKVKHFALLTGEASRYDVDNICSAHVCNQQVVGPKWLRSLDLFFKVKELLAEPKRPS